MRAEVISSTAPPSSPKSSSLPGCGGSLGSVGDGSCDRGNNNKACRYDGGDCCPCTCEDGDNPCGSKGFDCRDPTGKDACNAALAVFSASLSNFTSYNETEYPECHGVIGYIPYIGDGFCDEQNNNEECAYDGGDCCWCTCSEKVYSCGINGFDCLDSTVSSDCVEVSFNFPNSSEAPSSSELAYFNCTSRGGNPDFLGDGLCDEANNNGDCEYDGGDCCACTCADGLYSCGAGGFECLDPDLPDECANVTSSTTSTQTSYWYSYISYDDDQYPDCGAAGGSIPNVGNGFCDSLNNINECAYDGGDCCPCTCKAHADYGCWQYGFYCIDPTVPEACAATFNESNYAGYDDDVYSSFSNDDELVNAYPNCTGVYSYISDGWCDDENNNQGCDYDGGDCCECTCVDNAHACGIVGFDCDDPTVPYNCSGSSSMTGYYSDVYPNCSDAGGHVPWVGDGFCDRQNNIGECGYDAGDCCPCTCSHGAYSCGVYGYECQDPDVASTCVESTSSSGTSEITATPPPNRRSIECMGDVETVGNGFCDVENNNAYCKYDGGDCCECTCVGSDGSDCSDAWYDCQDPDAHCSSRIRTVGVAILSGAGVFVLMLCCFLVPRSSVAKRMCNRQSSTRSGEASSPQDPTGPVEN